MPGLLRDFVGTIAQRRLTTANAAGDRRHAVCSPSPEGLMPVRPLVRLLLIVLCAAAPLAHVAVSAQAAPAAAPAAPPAAAPADSLGRSTPRGTVLGFL